MSTEKDTIENRYTPAGGIIRKADPERLQESGYFNRMHDYDVPVSVELADLLQDTYWVNLAARLRQFDEIRCVSLRMYLRLLVLDIGPEQVRVVKIMGDEWPPGVDIAAPGAQDRRPQAGGDARFVYDGKVTKWQVWEGDRRLRQGFETEAQARSWYADHKRTQARA
jgi:hypothetical protein